MASALPPILHQGAEADLPFADPFAELASRAPSQAMSAQGQSNLGSPFTSSVSKVIIPRNGSTSSRASSTASLASSSRRSGCVRVGPNPFQVANASEAIEEGNEEEEVGAASDVCEAICVIGGFVHGVYAGFDMMCCALACASR